MRKIVLFLLAFGLAKAQQPVVRLAGTMTLFNAVDATGTATSTATSIPNLSAYGVMYIVGSGITGSPSGCQIALNLQTSLGANASAHATQAFTPASSTQAFRIVPSSPYFVGDKLRAVYSCSGYPSAGTLSVTFDQITPAAILEALPAGTASIGNVFFRNPGDTVNLGDGTNPVRVDPTGTTPQSVTQSGTWSTRTQDGAGTTISSTGNALHGIVRDAAGNARGANVNVSNQLSVSVDNTPSTNATLAAETTKVIGTVRVQDNAGNGINSTGNALHSVIRDAAGNARGANVNASNQLSVTVDNTPAVTATLAAETTKVIGTVRTQDGIGNNFLSAANALNSTGAGLLASQVIGQFDDTSPTTITENQFGNLRMSNNRNLYGTIRDAAGNERGANVTASNELLVNVNNTHAVTQSGTWTVQPGNTANTTAWLVKLNDGTNSFVLDPCQTNTKSVAVINMSTATTTRFIAPTSAKKNYICSIVLITNAANNVVLEEGTGGTCGTGTAGMSGDTTTGWALAANGGFTVGNGAATVFQTAGTNVDTCFKTSAATQLSGTVMYVQQ